jgi:hypothetical protein
MRRPAPPSVEIDLEPPERPRQVLDQSEDLVGLSRDHTLPYVATVVEEVALQVSQLGDRVRLRGSGQGRRDRTEDRWAVDCAR